MRVGIVGSDARTHALAWKLRQSKRCEALFLFPGNGGTSALGENVPISASNFSALARICEQKGISLLIICPEGPLVEGIVDYLSIHAKGLRVLRSKEEVCAIGGE